MMIENARAELPMWGGAKMKEADVKEYRPRKAGKAAEKKQPWYRMSLDFDLKRFGKRYGILLAAAAAFVIYTICLSAYVDHKATARVRQELAIEYASRLEQYKQEQAEKVQAEHWLSGEASREAFLNQEIDAAARLVAPMKSDTQKGGILCNAIARLMSGRYGGTLREVIEQPNQWMFYSKDNKITAHDRELAEKLVRDYYDGVVPNGLTKDFVYGAWSETDYVLRNTWEFGTGTLTWRYQG